MKSIGQTILVAFGLLYLAIPLLLFVITWISAPLAVLMTFAILVVVIVPLSLLRKSDLTNPRSHVDMHDNSLHWSKSRLKYILSALFTTIVAGVWTYLSGAGGYVYQNTDWEKHNGVLHDLFALTSPIFYEGNRYFLDYYLGWYMVPAYLGRLWGSYIVVQQFQFLYTFVGLLLVASSIFALFSLKGLKNIWLLVFFIFFATADSLGVIALTNFPLLDGITHLEHWASTGSLQLSSFSTLLFWVPGQAISSWLVILTLLRAEDDIRYLYASIAMAVFALFWSPLGMIGMTPFFLYFIYLLRGNISRQMRQEWLKSVGFVISCAFVTIFFALYYGATVLTSQSGTLSATTIFTYLVDVKSVGRYLVFVMAEILIPCGLLLGYWLGKRDEKGHILGLLTVSALTLLILSSVHVGLANDLMTRASIPALTVVFYLSAYTVVDFIRKGAEKNILMRFTVIALVIYYVFGVATPYAEIRRELVYERQKPDERVKTILDQDEGTRVQYLGNPDSFFGKYLVKK